MPHATKSALQDARDAFIAGLARRAEALRPVVNAFIADPGASMVRAELQRRLHSLLASAQLFEEPELVAQLQQLTSRLDEVGLEAESWEKADSDLLLSLISSLDPHGSRPKHTGAPPPPVQFPRRERAAAAARIEPAPEKEQPLASVRPVRNANPPPAPVATPRTTPAPTHQAGAVMLERVLLVCSRPHAAQLGTLLDEAPLELLHGADPEQALSLLEHCAPSYALISAEFATLPDIDLVQRLRHDPHHPVEGVYLMLPQGATYDADFVRQSGADGVLIEPISWEMLGPLLDRQVAALEPLDERDVALELEEQPAKAAPEVAADSDRRVELELRAAFTEPPSSAQDQARSALLESGRVLKQRSVEPKPEPVVASEARVTELRAVKQSEAKPEPVPTTPAPSKESPASVMARLQSSAPESAASVLARLKSGAPDAAATVLARLKSSAPKASAAELSDISERVLARIAAARAQASIAPQAAQASTAPQAAQASTAPQAALVPSSAPERPSHVAARKPSLQPPEKASETRSARGLVGRRILVVDDDPAMLWFFSGVVRDAGAEALQARDGHEALETARRKRPQLVLSDILMPKLDGFGVRRALQRDLWLERVPVLLLSWKGDPVETAEAGVMLRKEAPVAEVLAAIERALAPRLQLENTLRGEGDVSGSVEDVGIVTLIECVAAARPDAHLIVEDAAGVFELDLAEATQLAVTRTAADGTFTRAERALLQLMGVTRGRFHVRKRSGGLRSPLQTPLKPALHAAITEITALIEALSVEHIGRVARVSFDEEMLAVRLPEAPAFEPIVSSLRVLSLSPRELLAEGGFTSAELSGCLMQLARETAVTGLWGIDGQDLLASTPRLQGPATARPMPSLPPSLPARPVSVLPTQPEAVAPLESPVEQPALAKIEIATPEPTRPLPVPLPTESSPDAATTAWAMASLPPEPPPPQPEAARVETLAPTPAPTPSAVPQPSLHEAPALDQEEEEAPVARVQATEELSDADFDLRSFDVPSPQKVLARRRRREGAKLIGTLAASAVLGYVGALQLETHPALFGHSSEPIGTRGLEAPEGSPLAAASRARETSLRSGLDPGPGTVLPYIDTTRGVPVGSDEGLVIFEYMGPLPAPNIEIDGRVLGAPPLAVALAAKPHQLKMWVSGESSARTLSVRAAETRVITLPLSKP